MAKYKIRFFVDYYNLLWSGNEETKQKYDYPIDPETLPISKDLAEDLEKFRFHIDAKFNGYVESLKDNSDLQEQVKNLIERLQQELGADYEIADEMTNK